MAHCRQRLGAIVDELMDAFLHVVEGADDGHDFGRAALRHALFQPVAHPIGRNGMHHYDNQDHAMLSAIRSVGKYFGENVDPWQVNTDLSYQEQGLRR